MRNKIAALVLAGGYSSRMGEFKPLLPLGGATIIERAVNSFLQAGITDITVVVGHRADELAPVLERLQVRHVLNTNYAAGMFSSVVAGLQSLRPDTDAFFLLPGDMPMVKSHTIRVICRTFHRTAPDIVYPSFNERRGHPPLISVRCLPEILAWSGPGGLRPILERHQANACEVAVLDEGILLDADTPADYQTTLAAFCRRDIPTFAECQAILTWLRVSEPIVKHGYFVSNVVRQLTDHLNQTGLRLDAELAAAAGLLHDLAKGKPDHARWGAKILNRLGYPKVARLVAVHTDFEYQAGIEPDEAAVVYLADKLVRRDQLVSLDERFKGALEKYAAEPKVLMNVVQRRLTAQNIQKDIERLLGKDLLTVIPGEG